MPSLSDITEVNKSQGISEKEREIEMETEITDDRCLLFLTLLV